MQIIRGQKVKLADLLDDNLSLQLEVILNSSMVVDVALFALDDKYRLANDADMIFYNQPSSQCGSITLTSLSPQHSQFAINLAALPSSISRLTLTLAIDGQETMSQLKDCQALINNAQGQMVASFVFTGDMFNMERAIMLIEIYKKSDIWRISATAQGFNGGLAKLIEHFGGEVAEDNVAQNTSQVISQPQPQPTSPNNITSTTNAAQTSTIDLRKKVILDKAKSTNNASIIDLTKKSLVQLEKKNLLNLTAKVALVLDASGSMNWQYKNGDVQRVVDRVMPLAMSFDNDGSFECWAFGEMTQRLDDVTSNNVANYIDNTKLGWKNWTLGSRINREIPAINQVIDFYSKTDSKTPIYVLFVSDGGVGSKAQLKRLLTQAAALPIFWQFVGIGGKNYGILETLDEMEGRLVDNCNFFAIDNIRSLSDEELYAKLLHEFPDWLNEAKRKAIL